MSRAGTTDGADRLLAMAALLLPAERRDWGRAMRAESAAIESGRDRWKYVLSCIRVVVVQPAVIRTVGYPLLALALLVFVLRWSGGIGYEPLRWGVVATVALLLGVAWWGRHRGLLGPVGGSWVNRAVRAGGCLLVGAMTATFASAAGTHGPPDEQAAVVPFFALLLTSYLVGFLALTAHRTAVTGRALAMGVAASVAAAGVWAAIQLAFPPLSVNIGGSLVAIVFAIAAVVVLEDARGDGNARNTLLVAVGVATLAPLLVFAEVVLLSSYGPAWLIPDLVPAALSPADDVANSRIEIQDPYVAMLFLACLSALILTFASIIGRRAASITDTDTVPAPDRAATG